MTGRGEPGDIADLGGEDRGGDRADSVDGLDGVIAGVVTEHVTDARGELVDLVVERSDEDHDRFDTLTERRPEPRVGLEEMGEELAATNAEQIGHRHRHGRFAPGAPPAQAAAPCTACPSAEPSSLTWLTP